MLGTCLRAYPVVTAVEMWNESLKDLFLHLEAEAPGEGVRAGGKLAADNKSPHLIGSKQQLRARGKGHSEAQATQARESLVLP